MDKQQRDNSGVLFKNDRREKDSQPHATGSATIDGVEYFVSAWTKEGAKGKFQSLAFKPKDERKEPAPKPDPRKVSSHMDSYRPEELDDEIPF